MILKYISINWRDKKNIAILLLSVFFLVINIIYVRQVSNEKAWIDITAFLFIWVLVSFLYLINISVVKKFFNRNSRWINLTVLILSPVLSFIMLEIMVSNYRIEMFENYSSYNIIWYAVIYFLIFTLIRNCKLTIIISNFLIYFISLINYLVYLFRGNPILPSDLLAWRTGMSVASNYKLTISFGFIFATLLMYLIFILASKLEEKDKKISIKNRAAGIGIYLVFGFTVFTIFFHTNLIKSTISVLDFFAPKYTYCFYGTAFGFVANVDAMTVESPDGYTSQKVEEAFNPIKDDKQADNKSTEVHPNIIAIMSEAFSDLGRISNYKTNMEYLPFINSLQENTIKGNLYVSVFGGATSDTEYEFLTGNSMAVMPANSVPYQQFVTEKTDSLASTLKAQGYYNIAIHPYKKSGYKRDLVYPLLGFDEFLSMDDFKNPELIRSFISDRESFKKIIEEYETKGKDNPLFIFNVTMQNHGGYSDDRLFDDKNNVKFTDLNGYPNVEQYLSLVRQSDQAFKMLIDYFSKQKEPTLILLYGDHQPALYSDFHNKIEEANQMAVNTSKYLVPFVIWANYDIQEADVDKISANYLSSYLLNTAGLKGTKYNHYLMNLYKKLPVINGLFYIDKDNNCYNLGEQSKYSDLITEYRYIGYNNVFDKKNRLDNVYHLELR